MFRIPTEALRPGMRLGKNIMAADGRILLQAGTELRESYIRILQRMEVPGVYITNQLAPDIEPHDVVSERSRMALTESMREAMTEIGRTVGASLKQGHRRFQGGFDTAKLKAGVDMIVTELLKNPRALVNLQDIRSADSYTLGHSVNVCVLSVLMGMSAGYNEKQLHELGMGALMHDIGKVAIPAEILNKASALTPEEYELMKQHTIIGWEVLSKQPEISYVSSAMALQHHERWSGQGYPRQLKEKEIHPYSRICALADCYDAMTADRTYRKGYTPLRALKQLTELMSDYFDPDLLKSFAECVAVYPVGALVELSGGYEAIVVAVERGKNTRPKVRIVTDPGGQPLTKPVEIDLAGEPKIQILRTISEEAPAFVMESMT